MSGEAYDQQWRHYWPDWRRYWPMPNWMRASIAAQMDPRPELSELESAARALHRIADALERIATSLSKTPVSDKYEAERKRAGL